MTKSLFRVRLGIDRDEVVDAQESHTPREAQNEYTSWIVEPSGQYITFEGATFAAQLEREPNPKVRVALKYNSRAHPLISGAWIDECRPMTSNWLPDHLEDTNIESLQGYEVGYRTRSPKKEESARAALKDDVRDNFRYEIEDVSVQEDQTTLEVYIPEYDTGNHTQIQRLFPTAVDIRPLGRESHNEK